jgi:WD40 repeat protein
MKQRLILGVCIVILSAIMLLFPLQSSLHAQVGTLDLTALYSTREAILAPFLTLTARYEDSQRQTVQAQDTATAGVGKTQTLVALTYTSTPSSTYTPSATYTPSETYTPSMTLTPSSTYTATPFSTLNPTEVQQTLDYSVRQAATQTKEGQAAQTGTAAFQQTLAVIVGGSSPTATITPSLTITPTLGPTPTPNATELQQTLDAAVATTIAQTAQAQQGLTSTAVAQGTIGYKVDQYFTATAQAKRALLISGLTPLTVANASQITKLSELKGHAGTVTGVAFSPDGTLLASSGGDNSLRIWDVRSGNQIAMNAGLSDRLEVAFNPAGTLLAAGSSDGTVRTFSTADGKPVLVIKAVDVSGTKISSVAFSIDGTQIASGGTDGIIRVWDAASGSAILTLKGHSGAVTSLAFSQDGTRLLSGGTDGTVRVWELKTGTQIARYSDVQVTGVAISPDGTQIADSSYIGRTQIRDAQTGEVKVPLTADGVITAISFSPDGTMIASSTADGKIRVWDVTTGKQLVSLTDHAGDVTDVVFSSDGARLASSGDDGSVRIWGIQKTS